MVGSPPSAADRMCWWAVGLLDTTVWVCWCECWSGALSISKRILGRQQLDRCSNRLHVSMIQSVHKYRNTIGKKTHGKQLVGSTKPKGSLQKMKCGTVFKNKTIFSLNDLKRNSLVFFRWENFFSMSQQNRHVRRRTWIVEDSWGSCFTQPPFYWLGVVRPRFMGWGCPIGGSRDSTHRPFLIDWLVDIFLCSFTFFFLFHFVPSRYHHTFFWQDGWMLKVYTNLPVVLF